MRGAGLGISALKQVLVQPAQLEKLPPCNAACAGGADVRGWIALVAQRTKLGLSKPAAYAEAWAMVTATNPFPATLGRICPHPCEAHCSRSDKDGAVSIKALERFVGDWGLRRELKLPLAERIRQTESIGVIGAGPAGLSFAYQMARRGYAVTLYEKRERPGGMLHFGIPEYRLPKAILQAEIGRILDLGVALELNTAVGRGISVRQLRDRHDVLFRGIGAGVGLKLGVRGEDGTGVWTGLDLLSQVNRGERVELGDSVVVVGGGNTAMDAARTARRRRAQVTILYRRTRKEMPAIESEITAALDEGVTIVCLCTPFEIVRRDGRVRAVRVRRMELGKPDHSGRRTPMVVAGSEQEIPATAVIQAVSQVPDWEGLGELKGSHIWVRSDVGDSSKPRSWAGEGASGFGIAGLAIGHGRQTAEAVHAQLRNLPRPAVSRDAVIEGVRIKPDYYPAKARCSSPCKPAQTRLAQPDLEIQETVSETAFLEEASRCLSCGSCFGCEYCFMYCNAGAFSRLKAPKLGEYFSLNMDRCESCGKCMELCPSGHLSPRATDSRLGSRAALWPDAADRAAAAEAEPR